MSDFLPVAQPFLTERSRRYLLEAYDSSWISGNGPFNQRFEECFRESVEAPFALSVANGTVAIHLVLAALGVGPGDEVIVPTLTYIATANAVTYTGATPVLVDSEPNTWGLDPERVEDAITAKTRAIIVVHLYGNPSEIEKLAEIAEKNGLHLIEDCAEALETRVSGTHVGSWGVAATYSFFGNKLITTGEGGMITTSDSALYDQMALLRGQAMSRERRYWFEAIGYNYRMTNVQASIGLGQLEEIHEHASARREIANWYDEEIAGAGMEVTTPIERPGTTHSYWLYTILLPENASTARDAIQGFMLEQGVETRPVFFPLHVMPPYLSSSPRPVAEELGRRGLSLPTFRGMRRDDVVGVVQVLKCAFMESTRSP